MKIFNINYKLSIKRKLIVLLCIFIFPALTLTYTISFISAKLEVKEVFDAHLIKSAKLIFGLIRHEIDKKENLNFFVDFNLDSQKKIFDLSENKIHFQAWKHNKMIYSSDEKIIAKPDYEGFFDDEINGIKWHNFSFYDKDSDIRILVSEKSSIRNELAFNILLALFIPLFISFLPLLFVIITIINNQINSLQLLAKNIKKMSITSLEKFPTKNIPLELKPFIDSFNSLLERINNSIESERRFTDYAAHELKTPLAAIKIQAQLLSQNQNQEKIQEYINDLLMGVDRASHMINQLLLLTRLHPEFTSNNFQENEFDIVNLIESILTKLTPQLQKKNLKIILDLPKNKEKKLIIVGNIYYIEIMFFNLIDNAIKYSKINSEVNIEIAKDNSKNCRIKITNQGDFISSKDIDKIFDNFYRVTKSQNTIESFGSGLGLAICKKIINLHNGKISFKSSKDGLNSVIVEGLNLTQIRH